jgi:hypothetical protein
VLIPNGYLDVVSARLLLPIVGACLLSACAAPRWVKPDASKSDLAQDQSVCMRTLQEPPPPGTTNEQVYQACMTTRGWTLQQRAGKQQARWLRPQGRIPASNFDLDQAR